MFHISVSYNTQVVRSHKTSVAINYLVSSSFAIHVNTMKRKPSELSSVMWTSLSAMHALTLTVRLCTNPQRGNTDLICIHIVQTPLSLNHCTCGVESRSDFQYISQWVSASILQMHELLGNVQLYYCAAQLRYFFHITYSTWCFNFHFYLWRCNRCLIDYC